MRLIKPRSQGKAVQMLQELLQEQGYDISVSGYFNIETTEAVRDFQEKNGLEVDSVVYTETWTNLINKPPIQTIDQPRLSLGDQNEAVERLQELLNKEGYQLAVDGDFGPVTEDAVKDFQERKGLSADGMVFTKTWEILIGQPLVQTIDQPLLKLGVQGEAVEGLQELLNKEGYQLSVDGDFGPVTEDAVKGFQEKNGLKVDGVVFTETWRKLIGSGLLNLPTKASRMLREEDIAAFSVEYEIEIAVIKAVLEVESRGAGFLDDGRPVILFEGHMFWRQLKERGYIPQTMRQGFENVLYSSWVIEYYQGGKREWTRLEKAVSIAPKADVAEAAYCSASYGLFQIMGFNYHLLGYYDILEFVCDMKKNEQRQLAAFGEFLKANNLISYLQNHRWADFARRYNGPGYKKNHYDENLEIAYSKFA